jgi:3-methyladenine DNA glycosylase AlkD
MAERVDVAALADEIDAALARLPAVTTPAMRALRRGFSKRLAKAEARDVVALALRLLRRPGLAHRFTAYELVCHHRPALASLDEKKLTQLGRGIDSWAAVDTFACYLAGPAWREGQVGDPVVHGWACSPDRWWRRAALVCTVALNTRARGGRGDAARTLRVCGRLLADRDDMVVKALSWALRELAKRDPKAVRGFLEEHGASVAARVRREVGNKLRTGLKNPRKK